MAQVVGWPPIRNSQKNIMVTNNNQPKNKEDVEGKQGSGCLYVKVSMDRAPYLRKVDLKTYSNYKKLFFTIASFTAHSDAYQDFDLSFSTKPSPLLTKPPLSGTV